jgi:hypothetical protein
VVHRKSLVSQGKLTQTLASRERPKVSMTNNLQVLSKLKVPRGREYAATAVQQTR